MSESSTTSSTIPHSENNNTNGESLPHNETNSESLPHKETNSEPLINESLSPKSDLLNSVSKVNWQERIHHLTDLVNQETKRVPNPTPEENLIQNGVEDDSERRAVYVQLELARMDFEEDPDHAPFLNKLNHATSTSEIAELKQSEIGVRILLNLGRFDQLRNSLSLAPSFKKAYSRHNIFNLIFHNILTVSFILFSLPPMFFFLPLRLLHPVLRKWGVRNNFLPIDMIQKFFARGVLLAAGVDVRWENSGNLNPNQPTIAMSSHTSNFDPFIVACGTRAFKFVGKKILFFIPFLGWLLYGWGHIPINRSQRSDAIKSLQSATFKIRKWGRSIAVFPEGTRQKSGRIGEFKKGTFHTAMAVGLPITPVIIFGSYSCWAPQKAWGAPGYARVRVLPQIPVSSSDTYQTLLSKTRRLMLAGYIAPLHHHSEKLSWTALDVAFFPVLYLIMYLIYSLFRF